MTDEEMAEEYADWFWGASPSARRAIKQAYLAGLKAGKDMAEADLATIAYMQGAERYKTKWHKVADGDLPKPNIAALICFQFEKWTTTYIAYYRPAIKNGKCIICPRLNGNLLMMIILIVRKLSLGVKSLHLQIRNKK